MRTRLWWASLRPLIWLLESHSTPRNGSWLNVADIELSLMAQQCLDGSRLCLTCQHSTAVYNTARV